MKTFFMKPKIDYAFKEIMADEMARRGFLSAILRMPPEEISETILIDTHLNRKYPDDRLGILDVRLQLNDGTETNIEIQLSKLSVWPERSLFYICKMYTDKIKPGDKYNSLKKCISISILDFTLFEDSEDFYSRFHIAEDIRHTFLTDKFEFHVIELPKLPKMGNDGTGSDSTAKKFKGDFYFEKLTLWAKFINAEKKEEFEMIAQKDKYIDSAYQRLQTISRDRQKRLEYEAREKALRDYNQSMSEARQEGERMLALLLTKLTEDKRAEDIQNVLTDSALRKKLYKEYGINDGKDTFGS